MSKASLDYFRGRKLVIATMHGKEKVLAPILETSLGVVTVLPEGLNTDVYGTFSGEIEREIDPLETARIKCIDACKKSGCTLAVSSEGSFGAHPTMLYVPADDEIMVLMDMENDIYVRARVVSTKTNFNGNKFDDWDNAKEFAERVMFPSHGLIMTNKERSDVIKGIDDWKMFEEYFKAHLNTYGTVFLETDMRAMYNPMRMNVIAEVADRLIETVLRECPSCNFPGFDVSQINKGLPCGQCGLPTESTLSYSYECKQCSYSSIKRYPNTIETEDPR